MNYIRVSTRGRLTIPKQIRETLNIKVGTRVDFFVYGDKIVAVPTNKNYIYRLRGKFKGKGLLT